MSEIKRAFPMCGEQTWFAMDFQSFEIPLRPKGDTMLVLTRKIGERIIIGDSVVVTVVELGGGKVRLGIAAPADVPVHREEVYEALKEGGKNGAEVPTNPKRRGTV